MPVMQYFLFAGAGLLALLALTDAYLPSCAAAAGRRSLKTPNQSCEP
jgi:hypothetical protein